MDCKSSFLNRRLSALGPKIAWHPPWHPLVDGAVAAGVRFAVDERSLALEQHTWSHAKSTEHETRGKSSLPDYFSDLFSGVLAIHN